jgi:hypothetical protein
MDDDTRLDRVVAARDGLSHVVGRTDLPLSSLTIAGLLDQAVARWPGPCHAPWATRSAR